jgi:hypothetical protein
LFPTVSNRNGFVNRGAFVMSQVPGSNFPTGLPKGSKRLQFSALVLQLPPQETQQGMTSELPASAWFGVGMA